MSTVFIPQQPAKYDGATDLWLPTVDIRDAAKFGDIRIMFDMRTSRIPMHQLVEPLKKQLDDFQAGDYLVALGDPSIIALCAAYLGRKHNRFKFLTWDRFARAYIAREIDLGNS